MTRRNINCMACGKKSLDKNTIGINKKLFGAKLKNFYCVECLAVYLDVEEQDIFDKIEDFKSEGCKLFE